MRKVAKALWVFLIILLASLTLIFLSLFSYDIFCIQKTSSAYSPTVAAVFAALAAFLFSTYKYSGQKSYEKSKFYLESSIENIRRSYAMLADGNNERIIWIAAVRILRHSQQIAEKITEDEHIKLFEIEIDYQRIKYATFLKYSASFYYGVAPDLPLSEAAKQSNAGEDRYISKVRNIPPEILYALYEFTKFPGSYKDPNDAIWDTTFKKEDMAFLPQGLLEYIYYIQQNPTNEVAEKGHSEDN